MGPSNWFLFFFLPFFLFPSPSFEMGSYPVTQASLGLVF